MDWVRKATGSAAIIVDGRGRVLLMRRAYPPGDWVLPGGNAEADESPVGTVRREVREELGIELEPERLSGVYYQADHPAGEFIHFVFRGAIDDDAGIQIDPSEVAEHGFFETDALPQPMSPSTRRRLADGLRDASVDLPVTLPPRSEP